MFGAYALATPKEYRFKREPDWYWLIKPATWRDVVERDTLLSRVVYERQGDVERRVFQFSDADLVELEIWLTFGGSNIPLNGQEGSKELHFPDGINRDLFLQRLRSLPPEMVLEIHRAVREANPMWRPDFNLGN
jgi:hypothetical protein